MADLPPSPQSTKPRNPNWGGRRKGSGRKTTSSMPAPTELRRAPVDITRTYHNRLSTLIFFFSLLSKSIDTTQSQHLPVHTSTPARGFFAQRNRFQPEDLSSSNLHPNPATDREQGAAASVVPARLGLKAVGKAQLFTASAFQN